MHSLDAFPEVSFSDRIFTSYYRKSKWTNLKFQAGVLKIFAIFVIVCYDHHHDIYDYGFLEHDYDCDFYD